MMIPALGVHAPQLERVRALRTKTGRSEQGRFAVEGATMLAEALATGRLPEELYVTEGALAPALRADRRLAGRIFMVPERAMGRLSELETPPGLLAVHRVSTVPLDDALANGEPAVLLAGIADPGNAGTLLRSAEIFGIPTAIFTPDAVEPYNGKVVRATMGAIFRTRVVVAEATEILAATKRRNYTVVAAALGGPALPGYRFPARAILAIGNERRGVAASLPFPHESVSIPHVGSGESLNAAVAGGIVFYAFSQQERRPMNGS
ncbi:MAG: RNA methyltransferase [Vulcanimicrobiaceae bacterium]